MARRNRAAIRASVQNALGSSSFIVTAEINDLIGAVHRELGTSYSWSFRKRETVILTTAPYSVGTVTATQASPTIVGVGTTWTAGMIGTAIRIPGASTFY